MADLTTTDWRRTIRRRAIIAGLCLVAWSGVIEARLVYLQVVRHADLTARADRQQNRVVAAPAKRGEIHDRHNRLLAYSVDVDSVYAVPSEIADARAAAAALCQALDHCGVEDRRALEERLGRSRAFAYVQRFVSPQAAARVAALDLEGIGFMKENRRFYPNKELGAQVLGYVGVDNVGLGGIEAAYDKVISGHPGTVLVQTDARHRAFSSVTRPPTMGATLELTIDEYLQHIVERELAAGVTANKAEGGTAVVMDPTTGEILAMASYPTFNPNTFTSASPDQRKNRAVTDLYEPGSTFKIVTASAALEEGVVSPGDPIDVSEGLIRFKGRIINDDHRYGILSFGDVIVKSSNVGAIKVGLRLGPERLGDYVKRFGFGRQTSSDFPGESAGIVWDPARLNDSALASMSMGYQVGVTPLQMAVAASVVANGGHLLRPRIVRATVRDGARTATEPTDLRRAISARTAAELTTIMEDVVVRGTGRQSAVEGFTVAGKTGTAQKLVAGAYSHSEYNVSFVGFVPSRKPVLTIIVVVDTPRAGRYHGGSVSAPIFQRIADASLRHLGVAPTVFPAPPVLVDPRGSLPALSPRPATVITVDDSGLRAMPDLVGLGAREALRRVARLGVTAKIQGSGLVVAHYPEAGQTLAVGGSCTLMLDRGVGRSGRASSGSAP